MLPITTVQLVLLASLISSVLCGTLAPKHKDKEDVDLDADLMDLDGKGVVVVPMVAPRSVPSALSFGRAKRYVGWGRRPGLRYSKASSVFDFDNTFNKLYNKYEKRSQGGPAAAISNFRELRMKQKVPNAQLLMPHLYDRNTRGMEADEFGMDDRLNQDDVDALMFLLEEYAKNIKASDQ